VEHAKSIAARSGGSIRAVPSNELTGEIIIAATPYNEQVGAAQATRNVAEAILIDISNPLKSDYSGLVVGHTTSAAEEIAKALPRTRVVKAFNTIFAQVLADRTHAAGGHRVQVLYAGDDPKAKEAVRTLIDTLGFEPVDAGPLQNARYLEPLGMLNIWFGYTAKRGTDIAPAWVTAA
jgi:predicted dinucleotide-binding enzyme